MSGREVVVVGGGAAGLMAGIAAARAGARVRVLERHAEPGRKILVTGGGRCNLSNAALAARDGAPSRHYGAGAATARPALRALPLEGLRAFFAAIGVPTFSPDDAHYYPDGERAATVRDALCRALAAAGGEVVTACTVVSLSPAQITPAAPWLLREASGREFLAQRCVLATGGVSPMGGGGPEAWEPARALGLTLRPALPALAPIVIDDDGGDDWGAWATLAGVGVPGARLWLEGAAKSAARGDLLCTHHGFSGPAALDLSGALAAMVAEKGQAVLRVDFLPAITDWKARFAAGRRESGKKTVRAWLRALLPEALAARLLADAGAPEGRTMAEMTSREAAALAAALSGRAFVVRRAAPMAQAMVTRGGVAREEVSPRTLECHRFPGLFLAGEALDVDGPCGGFNLHWAFASGALAGSAAARS